MNKRGISSVLVTALIVLLTISLIVIFSAAIVPLITDNTADLNSVELLETEFKIVPISVIVDDDLDTISFTTRREGGSTNITRLNVVVEDDLGNGVLYEYQLSESVKLYETVKITFDFSDAAGQVTGSLESDVLKITVIPVFTDEKGNELEGDQTFSYNLGSLGPRAKTKVVSYNLDLTQNGGCVASGGWIWGGGCSSGWGTSGSAGSTVTCSWTDTITESDATITQIVVDPVSIKQWGGNGGSTGIELFMNSLSLGTDSSTGGSCGTSGSIDVVNPSPITNGDNYNFGASNDIIITKLGSDWYVLDEATSIDVTVTYETFE
jgi:hypothetical protein